jgi:hypothetical protein
VKPQLGRLASLLVALLVTFLGVGYTWFTLDTQHALKVNGVTDTAEVTAVHHPVGKLSFDSIDVRLPRYPDDVEIDRIRGDQSVGDQLLVRYDRNDPTRAAQVGVSLWGMFEFFMLFLAIAGMVSSIIGIRRWPRGRRSGRPFQPNPRPDNDPHATTPWATKSRRNKRRT